MLRNVGLVKSKNKTAKIYNLLYRKMNAYSVD